jgi:hypothetical protein
VSKQEQTAYVDVQGGIWAGTDDALRHDVGAISWTLAEVEHCYGPVTRLVPEPADDGWGKVLDKCPTGLQPGDEGRSIHTWTCGDGENGRTTYQVRRAPKPEVAKHDRLIAALEERGWVVAMADSVITRLAMECTGRRSVFVWVPTDPAYERYAESRAAIWALIGGDPEAKP